MNWWALFANEFAKGLIQEPMLLATVAIAVAALVNLLVTRNTLEVTRYHVEVMKRMFIAQHRPYLAIADVRLERGRIVWKLKNVSSIPGTVTQLEWYVLLDGERASVRPPAMNIVFMPNTPPITYSFNIVNPTLEMVGNGTVTLRLAMRFRYEFAGDSYGTSAAFIYNHTDQIFSVVDISSS